LELLPGAAKLISSAWNWFASEPGEPNWERTHSPLAIPAELGPSNNINGLRQVRHQNESTETKRFPNKCLTSIVWSRGATTQPATLARGGVIRPDDMFIYKTCGKARAEGPLIDRATNLKAAAGEI